MMLRAFGFVLLARGSVGSVLKMQQDRVSLSVQSTNAAQVVHVGGNANNGTNAGVFYLNSNNDASNRNRNIGTRLIRLNSFGRASSPLGEKVDHNSLVGRPKNWVWRNRL